MKVIICEFCFATIGYANRRRFRFRLNEVHHNPVGPGSPMREPIKDIDVCLWCAARGTARLFGFHAPTSEDWQITEKRSQFVQIQSISEQLARAADHRANVKQERLRRAKFERCASKITGY